MTTRSRRPTIRDVAERAGVSKSLVSLALRDDAGVSDTTRARIKQAAADLGYRSNSLARALVQGRTGQVGVVVTDLTNPYHAEVALGVEDAATTAGLTTLLANGRRDPGRLAAHLHTFLELNVDGLVVVSSRVEPEVLSSVAREVPVTVVGRPESLPAGVDNVAGDDRHGARLATEHLLGAGHRRIAFATASTRPAARARRAGYAEAMRAAGLGDGTVHVVGDDARDDSIDAVLDSDATAVFANHDLLAVDLLDRAVDRGIAVPERLAVIGYDDTDLAARVRPRLSSVDQRGAALGGTALDLLRERAGGRSEDRHAVLTPVLRVRSSSA
ncbi:DNA-binding LacI/PurR family transcriptional regulator [Mumia flava]|uniref:DNA-binding LacI/PurR family transcriptional regulator n=1 Tax=Mumia flava TaxID=1348852 RepID=A0A0B2BNT2_9ACTN|nr:LacI family DNA-binding transcriptional regulator [Mumia flava]PJJ56513.1 DNA-binding LacI/PurR family transcriptional regulator [Mumia flava]